MSDAKRKWQAGVVILACSAAPLLADLNEDRDPAKDILRAIDHELSSLEENSLELPNSEDEAEPPSFITEAGDDFVTAWRLYRDIVMQPREPSSKVAIEEKNLINAHEEWELFKDLITRTIEADPPPEISEYSRFTYSSLDSCGDGSMTFMRRYKTGLILANIRHGNHYEALKMYSDYNRPSCDILLRAFGADAEMFSVGKWLNKRCLVDEVSKTGGERTATMLMRWIDLHHAEEVETRRIRKKTHVYIRNDLPYFPSNGLISLLLPENGVTDETKKRIASYIGTRGLEIAPLKQWIYHRPNGAEKWMAPLAVRGLKDPLNEVRLRSSRLLDRAGVNHEPPEMRPDPRFEIFVNGKPFPKRFGALRLNLRADDAFSSAGFKGWEDGCALYDADDFRENGDLKSAHFTVSPFTVAGKIKLPIDFEGINRVNIIKRELKILPVFPMVRNAPEDRTYAVSLSPVEKDVPWGRGRKWVVVKNHKPHTYWHVSPGEYWLGVRYPGGVWEPDRKITVGNDKAIQRPVIKKGSNIVVPVLWAQMATPESLPRELATHFVWFRPSLHESLRSIVRIKGDGVSDSTEHVPIPESADGRFPNSVIFPYLPPGKYTIESPDRIIKPTATSPGCVIKRTSIEVEIKKDSPIFVVTEPLEIDYSVKE
ncbi:MAG: hypothetical protein ACSHX9_08940 [Luteolibacter sp.]